MGIAGLAALVLAVLVSRSVENAGAQVGPALPEVVGADSDGRVSLQWQSEAGVNYQIERMDATMGADWQPAGAVYGFGHHIDLTVFTYDTSGGGGSAVDTPPSHTFMVFPFAAPHSDKTLVSWSHAGEQPRVLIDQDWMALTQPGGGLQGLPVVYNLPVELNGEIDHYVATMTVPMPWLDEFATDPAYDPAALDAAQSDILAKLTAAYAPIDQLIDDGELVDSTGQGATLDSPSGAGAIFRIRPTDTDTDGDGVNDRVEFLRGSNLFLPDSDGDGLSDFAEIYFHGTAPSDPDSDGNGINDGDQHALHEGDLHGDPDGDGLTNEWERIYQTDPENPDTDGDGAPDGAEAIPGDAGFSFPRTPETAYLVIEIDANEALYINDANEVVVRTDAEPQTPAPAPGGSTSSSTPLNPPEDVPNPQATYHIYHAGALTPIPDTGGGSPSDLGNSGHATGYGFSAARPGPRYWIWKRGDGASVTWLDDAAIEGTWTQEKSGANTPAWSPYIDGAGRVYGQQRGSGPGTSKYFAHTILWQAGGGNGAFASIGGGSILLETGGQQPAKTVGDVHAVSDSGVAVARRYTFAENSSHPNALAPFGLKSFGGDGIDMDIEAVSVPGTPIWDGSPFCVSDLGWNGSTDRSAGVLVVGMNYLPPWFEAPSLLGVTASGDVRRHDLVRSPVDPTYPGGYPYAINNRGEIVLGSSLWRNSRITFAAELLAPEVRDRYTTLQLTDINNSGTITGTFRKKIFDNDGDHVDSERVAVMMVPIGVQYDADNNDGTGFPTGGEEERAAAEEIEPGDNDALLEAPGKILFAMSGDIDGDGVPDFADGFSDKYSDRGIGREGLTPSQLGAIPGAVAPVEEEDTPQTADLVPIVLSVPVGEGSNIAVEITYDASDPDGVTKEASGEREYYRLPAEGTLRLWTKNRQLEDCSVAGIGTGEGAGDFVPDGTVLDSQLFEQMEVDPAAGGYVFWVESVVPSEEIREQWVRFQVYEPAASPGPDRVTYLDQKVYFSTVDMNLAQLVEPEGGGETKLRSAAGEVALSHPSPLVDITTMELSEPRWGEILDDNAGNGTGGGEFGWVVDVEVAGTISSPLLDTLTEAQGGVIDEAWLHVNGADEPARHFEVTFTKGSAPGDIARPFPYSGTFSETFQGVAATDGLNTLQIRTADGLYQLDGYHEMAYTAVFPPPPEEDDGGGGGGGDPPPGGGSGSGTPTLCEYVLTAGADADSYTIDAEGAIAGLLVTREGAGGHIFSSADGTISLTIIANGEGPGSALALTLGVGFAKEGAALHAGYVAADGGGAPAHYRGEIATYTYGSDEIELTAAAEIAKSDGGEFHPYVWEFAGPVDLLESLGDITFVDRSPEQIEVQVEGGAAAVETNVDITKVVKEMEEQARLEAEARERMIIANALNSDAAGIVSFRSSGQDLTPSVADEFYAAVSKVRQKELSLGGVVEFGAGYAVGFGKGGVEMVGGIGKVVVATGKLAVKGATSVVRGACWSLKFGFKLVTGQSVEAERRQAAAAAAKARKAADKVVKTAKFFKELAEQGGAMILGVLSGDFSSLQQMSGAMRQLMVGSVELFAGMVAKYPDDPYQKGYYAGRASFEVASFFLPWGAAFKAIQVAGRVSKAKLYDKLRDKSAFFRSGAGKDVFETAAEVSDDIPRGAVTVALETTKMCFVAGTPVWARVDGEERQAAIESLEPLAAGGHEIEVWARDEYTGQMGWRRILQHFTTHPDELVHVEVDSNIDGVPEETLSGTLEHPFWVESRSGWIPMGDLQEGDALLLADGASRATVSSTRRERAPPGETFTTYNFEVEDFHTYFVGESGVWVHNTGRAPCEKFFSIFRRLLDKGDNPGRAFNKLTSATPNATQPFRMRMLWGAIDQEIPRLAAENKLSPRFLSFASNNQGQFVASKGKEALTVFRFEDRFPNRSFRKPIQSDVDPSIPGQTIDSFDIVEVGSGKKLDIVGPGNSIVFEGVDQLQTPAQSAIDELVRSAVDDHLKAAAKGDGILIDLSGFSTGQQNRILTRISRPENNPFNRVIEVLR